MKKYSKYCINQFMKTILKNLEETLAFAKEFSRNIKGGDILTLSGDLGTGKTSFTKGLALGLGIKSEITSPTFTLMNIYKISDKLKLVHIDTYRLESEKQLLEIGAEDYFGDSNSIVVVEWPEKIDKLLKNKKVTKIEFRHSANDFREIVLSDKD